jgi:hypothetical protein
MATEKWSYFNSLWFGYVSRSFPSSTLHANPFSRARLFFLSLNIILLSSFVYFTTLGYGNLAPKTEAGRAFFVVWAILGIGNMTILISGPSSSSTLPL